MASNEPVAATIWLAPHDAASFEAAIVSRTDPLSPDYHHWMTAAQVAASGAAADEVAGLVRALRAAGLTVSARGDAADALRVTGRASVVEAAFGTAFRRMSVDGREVRTTVSAPRFAGADARLIAGITGLDTTPMTPFVLPQRDPATGRPVQFPLAAVTSPSAVFTDDCFTQSAAFSLSHFIPNNGTEIASLNGPQYVSTGVAPATNTCGYTPAQISAHYGLTGIYNAGYQGAGQTIVLVDAYGSPTILSDANAFSAMMGLPSLTSNTLQVIYADGPPIANPYPTGWPVEISLDVEWAHAIAPQAKLVLVVAPSDDADDLAYALHYAVSHHLGQVISNSYGFPEATNGPAVAAAFNAVIRQAAAVGINVDVSTGDSGDFGLGTPVGAASIPADSPYATGVGGTSLGVPSDDGPVESSWGTTETFVGDINGIAVPVRPGGFRQGGGGGESVYLEKPQWQSALRGTGRLLPDVSAVADPFTGAIIVTPNATGTASVVEVIGGTSLSSPIISGMWALADQAAGRSLGQAAPIIARLHSEALTDILPVAASLSNLSGTVGTVASTTFYTPAALLGLTTTQPNGFVGTGARITSPTVGIGALLDIGFGADSSLMALPGWDDATGFGVPNGVALMQAVARVR